MPEIIKNSGIRKEYIHVCKNEGVVGTCHKTTSEHANPLAISIE